MLFYTIYMSTSYYFRSLYLSPTSGVTKYQNASFLIIDKFIEEETIDNLYDLKINVYLHNTLYGTLLGCTHYFSIKSGFGGVRTVDSCVTFRAIGWLSVIKRSWELQGIM